MRKLLIGLTVVAAALLGGCATTSLSPEQMRAEVQSYSLPKNPEPGEAMIYVVRPSGLGGLIRFNVFLNDQQDSSEMGYTRSSQYIYFAVPPGRHRVYSKAETWAEVEVALSAGEVAYVRQEPTIGIVMARNNLFVLPDYEGKYYVKTLSPGTMHKTVAPPR